MLFDNRFVLFQKLVEQHRVHRFVAHAVKLSFLIAHHQIRIYLFHLFGDETELRVPVGSISFLYRNVTGFSAIERFAALSIGLMSSLNRWEEVACQAYRSS